MRLICMVIAGLFMLCYVGAFWLAIVWLAWRGWVVL